MIPGYWPGASGQATKLGIWPYLVVTMTSFSYMGAVSSVRQIGAESLARLRRPVTRFDPPRRAGAGDAHIYRVMIRFAALALLFSTALTAAAAAQTVAPSATPTNGAVGSAAQRNGYPAVGGAVSLPSIANSSTTTTAPLAGTTSSPAFLSSPTSTSATGVGLGGTGQAGGSGGAG